MAHEVLERLQQSGSEGVITFPDIFSNFSSGKIRSATGAARFSLKWHQDRVELDEQSFFYMTDK